MDMITTTRTREDVTAMILQAKKQANLTWEGIAASIGMSPVWTHSAAMGMNAMPAEKADALVATLGLPPAATSIHFPRVSVTCICSPSDRARCVGVADQFDRLDNRVSLDPPGAAGIDTVRDHVIGMDFRHAVVDANLKPSFHEAKMDGQLLQRIACEVGFIAAISFDLISRNLKDRCDGFRYLSFISSSLNASV